MSIIAAVLPTIIVGAIKSAVSGALQSGTSASPAAVADEVVKRLAKDPVAVNELNGEKPYQSRVAVGSFVAALGVILPQLGQVLGFDGGYVMEVITAAVTLWGAGYALYGRFASGLKPLFSRK